MHRDDTSTDDKMLSEIFVFLKKKSKIKYSVAVEQKDEKIEK